MTTRRRELLISAAFAVWGLAVALATINVFRRPAPPGQTMGAATMLNFDATGPLRWIGALMLLPVLFPLVLRPLGRWLAAGRLWATSVVVAAPLVTLWLITVEMSVRRALVPCAAAIAIAAIFRKRDMRFTRYDVVLVPVFLTTLISLIDVIARWGVASHVAIAALLVLAVRIGVTFVPSPLPPALAFLAAPLGLILQTGFFARDQRYFGWHALLLVVATPFVLRFLLRDRRRAIVALVFVVYPLSLFSYWNAMSQLTAEGKPRANFFEDGHSLLPASEYLRGERAYRDILPGHGLIEDGLFEYLVFQGGEVTIGRTLKTREIVGSLNAIALYVLAWAVTGSPHAGLLAVILSILMGVFAPTVRMVPPIATLAALAGAVRWRKPRWWAYAGFGTVLCGATSLDFGAYAFLTLVVALLRVRQKYAWKWTAIGVAAGAIPLFLGFALLGILDDFIRGTFFEIPSVSSAYTLGFHSLPEAMSARNFFPEVLSEVIDPSVFHYLFWPAMTIFAGVTVTRRWPRRFEPLVLLGVWTVLTGISYAERHHLYFGMAAAVMIATLIVYTLRRRSVLAFVLIGAAIVLSNPTTHVAVVAINRGTRVPQSGFVQIRDLPRAAGAYWSVRDYVAIESVRKYVAASLKPDETFLDFTNSALLYYLLDRDCPIRQYEVAFFQSEEAQRDVIRRLSTNPKIRAVLVTTAPNGRFTVEAPNAWRAPLVQQYILENFQPDFEEGEIAFWRRR